MKLTIQNKLLNAVFREMFFTNQFKLEKAAMDGTRRKTLINIHTHQVSGIVGKHPYKYF